MVPCRWVEGSKPPLCQWQGSLFDWVEVFHITVDDDRSSKTWHRGVHTHYIPPMVLLLWFSSMAWAEDIYPSTKCMQSCRHPTPTTLTWSLHLFSVDTNGRSHSFPLIHPREVFLAWCWMITRPLSTHGILLLSLPLGVGLTGVGLVHLSHALQTPIHRGTSVTDAMGSQLQCRMCDCLHWSIISYEGMSVTIWCTTSWGPSSHLSLVFLFPWKVSAFTKTKSPGFRSMAPIFWS